MAARAPRASQVSCWLPKLSGRPGSADPIRDAGEGSEHKGGRNQRRRRPHDSPGKKQSPFGPAPRRCIVMVAKAFHPPTVRRPDPGRGRRKRAQREPESATPRAARFAGQKAIPIRARRRAAVSSWSPKPSTRRRFGGPIRDAGEGSEHKGSRNRRRGRPHNSPGKRQFLFGPTERRIELMAHEALIQQDGFGLFVAAKPAEERLAPQSIIAALRMQTIVAWAGFALKLRMR